MLTRVVFLWLVLVLIAPSLHAQTFQINNASQLPPIGRGGFESADINNDGVIDVIFSGVDDSGNRFAAVYRNNNDGTFTNFGVSMPQLSDGDIAIGDVNNDGLIDIFITGTNDSNERESQLLLNQGGGIFAESSFEFEGLSFGKAVIADLNNDGDRDIVVSGFNSLNIVSTLIYINEGNGQFQLDDQSIIGVSNGDVLTLDFNNDSYIDIIVSGLNNLNQRVTNLYINNQNESFTLTEAGLPAIRSGSLAAADYNQDGFTDLFISGNTTGSSTLAEVYLNNSGGGFVLFNTLPSLEQGAAAWGDYDLDGDLDIMYSGFENPNFRTFLYENTLTGFVDSGIAFPGLTDGNINWLDYDGDNKLDLIISGFSSLGTITNVYENVLATPNTRPYSPSGLVSLSQRDSVVLNWNLATDLETASQGLSYNIYVGTAPGQSDIVAPDADITTGLRKVPMSGKSTSSTVIKSLPENVYYWGVQSIDAGFLGSIFSSEQSFVICDPVEIGMDTSVCEGQILRLEAGQGTDIVNWFSREQGAVASNTQQLDFLVTQNDSIYVEVNKLLGCVVTDGLNVTALPLPVVELGPDQRVCTGNSIMLEVTGDLEDIQWSSTRDGMFSQALQLEYFVDQNDTISVMITDIRGCVNFDTLRVEALALPIVDLGADQMVCLGSEIELTIMADSANWTTSSGLTLINNTSLQLEVNQSDTISVEIFDLTSRCSGTDTLIVDFFDLPIADAGEDQITCIGTPVMLGGDYSNVTGLTFSWTPSNTLDDNNVANPMALPSATTDYVLTITDQNGCSSSDATRVVMDSLSVIMPGADRNICIGTSTELGGTPTAIGSQLEYTFSWSPVASLSDPSSANPIASPVETTTYTLITRTLNCIIDTSEVTIVVNPLPIVTVDPEEITIGLGETITLNAEGGTVYSWIPVNGLSDPSIPNPEASPQQTTTYEVEVTDANGCVSSGEVLVIVKNQIFIPELFTPNADLNNDEFKVFGEGIERLSLKIYDRNSELVYESNDVSEIMNNGWDGTKDGTTMRSGHYVWSIEGEFFDGTKVDFLGRTSGVLKLIR